MYSYPLAVAQMSLLMTILPGSIGKKFFRIHPPPPTTWSFITVNGVHFDYVQETKNHTIYVKIWDNIGEGFPKAEFQKIETVTTKNRPFYENIYFLFSASKACNYVEQLRNLNTVAVVNLKSLLGQKNKELF